MRAFRRVLGACGAVLWVSACTSSGDNATEPVARTQQSLGGGANGTPCASNSSCSSGYCYPGPDQSYCSAATANCAQPGTNGVQYGTSYVYNGVTYACVAGEGLLAPPFGNGLPCDLGSDCTSSSCSSGPAGQSYCMATSSNCAQPGTSGVDFGASYSYQGATYDCVAGSGLEIGPFANGLPCKSWHDCTSHYCYPGPDQTYCIAATANCAQPGTSGAQFGTSYTYEGSKYDCVAGQGLEAPPFTNGAPCQQDSDCGSNTCAAGPDQSYCIAASANCAQPGTSGVQYGASYVYQGATYDCIAGTGLETGPFADGLPCKSSYDCSSHYCYPGPDQMYCISESANCAQPGTSGVQFGTSYSYNGSTYDCIAGEGLQGLVVDRI